MCFKNWLKLKCFILSLNQGLLLLVFNGIQVVAEHLPRDASVDLSYGGGFPLEETCGYPADLGLLVLARPRSHQVVARVLRVEYLDKLVLDERQKCGARVLQVRAGKVAARVVNVRFLGHVLVQVFAARWRSGAQVVKVAFVLAQLTSIWRFVKFLVKWSRFSAYRYKFVAIYREK